jgi:polyphosphate kinase 2 (PPK2 family)
VLVVRVHEALLARQKLPPGLVTKSIWAERCEDIVNIERYLARNGFLILKFFLNLSRGEQKQRFLERLENPDKHWKFSTADARERGFWGAYMKAYEAMIRRTATAHAPWHVVPADKKWYSRLVVAAAVVEALGRLDLRYPEVGAEKRQELAEARRLLAEED